MSTTQGLDLEKTYFWRAHKENDSLTPTCACMPLESLHAPQDYDISVSISLY